MCPVAPLINDRLTYKDPDRRPSRRFSGAHCMQDKNTVPGQLDHIVLADVFIRFNDAPQAAYDITRADARAFGEPVDMHDQPGMPRVARVGIGATRASDLDQNGLRGEVLSVRLPARSTRP